MPSPLLADIVGILVSAYQTRHTRISQWLSITTPSSTSITFLGKEYWHFNIGVLSSPYQNQHTGISVLVSGYQHGNMSLGVPVAAYFTLCCSSHALGHYLQALLPGVTSWLSLSQKEEMGAHWLFRQVSSTVYVLFLVQYIGYDKAAAAAKKAHKEGTTLKVWLEGLSSSLFVLACIERRIWQRSVEPKDGTVKRNVVYSITGQK